MFSDIAGRHTQAASNDSGNTQFMKLATSKIPIKRTGGAWLKK